MTRIMCNQLAPTIGDLAANTEMTIQAIRRSVEAGADLIVMPELSLAGYMFTSTEEARTVAITPEHPVFTAWADEVAATNGVVVGGFAELGDDGRVYNSAAVVDGTGVLATYRKDHLWDNEKNIFTPGSAVPPVVDTPVGRLGIIICYDLEFPEMTRSLALRGADLIAVPTNWPSEVRPAGERAAEIIIAMAAAHINHVGIACCDRSGLERGQEWVQGTSIINELGWIIATAGDATTAVADLDLTLSRDKTITPLCDSFGDRRPELYSAVTMPKETLAERETRRRGHPMVRVAAA